MDGVRKALRKHRTRLLALDNVVGVGIGRKEREGRSTGQLAVTVLVTKKLPPEQLPRDHIIPKTLEGVLTDVVEVGHIRLVGDDPVRRSRNRPAFPGVSIGHYGITAGTFGAVVYDLKTGRKLILSNNHVLANLTNGRDGRANVGDAILQPGPYDGGSERDRIATLLRFVPLERSPTAATCALARAAERAANWLLARTAPAYRARLYREAAHENLVDAAVALPDSPELVSEVIYELGPVTGKARPEIGMRLSKSGRTTGVTTGEIKVVEATVRVFLGDVGEATFSEQIVTTPMAQPGDSGSLMVTQEENLAVGLLSAGSERVSIGGTFENVERLLGVSILPV